MKVLFLLFIFFIQGQCVDQNFCFRNFLSNKTINSSCKIFYSCYLIKNKIQMCECIENKIDQLRLNNETIDLNLNGSYIIFLSNYFETSANYFVLIGFTISLVIILILWFIVCLCQKKDYYNATDFFISSTPIDSYSPINSMLNVSPINFQEDQSTTESLLAYHQYTLDIPLYEDIQPPSYEKAIKLNSQ